MKARSQNLVGSECLNGIHTVDFDFRIATFAPNGLTNQKLNAFDKM
ncbi:MAG: hypothetical protein OXI67_00360 [Candidatus Poribacteria bacterium]|nr:hypothetical protein [Candidatus Poribacteria bacterium]